MKRKVSLSSHKMARGLTPQKQKGISRYGSKMETEEWINQEKRSENSPSEIDEKVHHHARLDSENGVISQGIVTTLCGMQIKPRPQAKTIHAALMCIIDG